MKALELKIPPAILMLVFAGLMWAADHFLPKLNQSGVLNDMIAKVVMIAAMLLIAAGILSFKKAKTTVNPIQPNLASFLVTSGIYRMTRNPMYLGFLLILLAWGIKIANPVSLILLPFFVLYMNQFQIKPEEHALIEVFGEPYRVYMSQVRRWI